MTETEGNRLLINSVLNICEIFSIDVKRLFASLGLETTKYAKATDNIKLKKEDIQLLVKFIQVYRFIDQYCGGDIQFIHHWIDTENKYFDTTPRECFYTKNGIKNLYEYVQRFS
jgi:hypothetical protein